MPSTVSSNVSTRWMLAVVLGGGLLAGAMMGHNDTRAAEGAGSKAAEGAGSKAGGDRKPVVAVVDLFAVLNESRMYKDLKERLREGAEAKRGEAARRDEAAKQAQQTMQAFKRTAPEFREKFKAFVDAAVDYNAYVRLSQAEQVLLLNKGTWEVYQAVLDVVNEVARDKGVDLVLYLDSFEPVLQDTQRLLAQIRQRKVVFASASVDLTAAVQERFDATYRKIRAGGTGGAKKGG